MNKKLLIPLVALIVVLVGVLAVVIIQNNNSDSPTPQCAHQWIEADCITPQTCQICGQTQGTATGHDFSLEIIKSSYLYSEATTGSPAKYYYACTFCKQKGTETFEYGAPLQDEWGYNYYVDYQFGEETDEWYVTTMEYIDGTFENSATENSPLLVEILYDCNDEISIFLYEYADEDNLVKNSSSQYKDYYKIVVKNEKGQTYEARGQMWAGDDRIFVIDTYHSSVLNLMKTSQKLKFYIEFEDSPATQYRFEVDMTNFNDVVNDMQ